MSVDATETIPDKFIACQHCDKLTKTQKVAQHERADAMSSLHRTLW